MANQLFLPKPDNNLNKKLVCFTPLLPKKKTTKMQKVKKPKDKKIPLFYEGPMYKANKYEFY